MDQEQVILHQSISLTDRKTLRMDGVSEVVSFDDVSIILRSCLGALAIDGQELHIRSLSVETGELLVEGVIGGIVYFDEDAQSSAKHAKKRGFFRGRGGA